MNIQCDRCKKIYNDKHTDIERVIIDDETVSCCVHSSITKHGYMIVGGFSNEDYHLCTRCTVLLSDWIEKGEMTA